MTPEHSDRLTPVTEADTASKSDVPPPTIRPARMDDLATLIAIEAAAGAAFRDLGMDAVADADPGSPEELEPYVEAGRAFVAVDTADRPVGYLLVDAVDGAAHIEQVSVHPDHARRRIGRALIEHALSWAHRRDLYALTLTTYVEVPWNGPYYERLGFSYLAAENETPGLSAIRKGEQARGLDAWPRACMRLSLRPRA
jgi:GNAT superfamily N-acetyltransferase